MASASALAIGGMAVTAYSQTADSFNPGANTNVLALAVQADGKVLAGGFFTNLAGQARNRIGRINADGTPDSLFNPALVGAYVSCLGVQTDGKILVGGSFTMLGGQSRTNIGRLNTNGTPDSTFTFGANSNVYALALQADGKLIVAGNFTRLAGQQRGYLGRLNTDGSLDTGFTASANSWASSVTLQADGSMIVGGNFSTLAGQPRTRIGRLKSNGALDTTFDPGANNAVYCLALQGNGQLLAGGAFKVFGGQSRTNIGRLNNTDPATNVVTTSGSSLFWQRGGSSPEVWRTTLETSTNSTDWTSQDEGTRIAGGWQWSGLALPTNTTAIRTRGFVSQFNGSVWFVETVTGVGFPDFVSQPVSRTNNAGTTATFSATTTNLPNSFQWLKGGVPLSDGGKISGAQTVTLTLTNVLHAEEGGYSLVISNSYGSKTSEVASLTVVDPFITSQPADQIVNLGEAAVFSVAAVGSSTLQYQWRRSGTNLATATQAALLVANAQATDAANYDVVVSNDFGARTSSVAALTVNLVTADDFNPGAEGFVQSLAIQPDGWILAGGLFETLGGQARTNIGRLDPQGVAGPDFNLGSDGEIGSLALETDGRILAAGLFSELGGVVRTNIGRLTTVGTTVAGFAPAAFNDGHVVGYPFLNTFLSPQPDGKILAWGQFTNLAGQARTYLGRLNTNGTLDTAFNPSISSGQEYTLVYCAAQQPDGKILVGGFFTNLAGQARSNLGRLNTNGTLDSAFVSGVNGTVWCLAVQPDGKILVGGSFTTLNGQARTNLGRLHSDGTLDDSFNPDAYGGLTCLTLQADGKILAGGFFSKLGGQLRAKIGRLNPDGTLDSNFAPAVNVGNVYVLAPQADGKILVGGIFNDLAGQSRSSIGRLNNTYPATQSLSYDELTITWLRGGSSPEVWRTSFDVTTNGFDWLALGAGERTNGGWQLTGVDLPTNAVIRARGYISCGMGNGSSYFVESTAQALPPAPPQDPPTILVDDGTFGVRSNLFGFSISGSPGQVVIVETSTNLVNWWPLATNTLGAGPYYFNDPDWLDLSMQFYRLLVVP